MSAHKALLRELAARISAGQLDQLGDYFAPTFELKAPLESDARGAAAAHIAARALLAHGDEYKLQALDMIEEGDHIAVRWMASWRNEGRLKRSAIFTIYRFENGRIAEDWSAAGPLT